MTTTIREAAAEDIPLLVRLIRGAFTDVAQRFELTPENNPTHGSNCTADQVQSAMGKGQRFFILEQDQTPCGCVAIESLAEGVGKIRRLGVLPGFRGRGLGETLVHHILGVAREMGAGRVEIGIIAAETHLRDWYGRLGFVVEKEGVFVPHVPFAVTYMAIAQPIDP